MKHLLAAVLCLTIVLSLSACGGNNTSTPISSATKGTVAQNETGTEDVSSQNTPATNSDNAEWEQFLNDYEAWVDDYAEIVKKYKANPSDTSVLADYTEMASDMAEWSEKADKIQLELKDTDEAAEYSTKLSKIAEKLAEIAK